MTKQQVKGIHFGVNIWNANTSKEFIDAKKCEYHEKNCKYNNEDSESEDECDDVICFRCGREGHYANSCYASKHIKGYYLK